MSKRIVIHPHKYQQLGSTQDVHFCLVTNSSISSVFSIEDNGEYASKQVFTYDNYHDFDSLLDEHIPERAHILVISPECIFSSPNPSKLGQSRKLIALACNSTPTSLEDIEHFLSVIENTDSHGQQSFAARFFNVIESCEYLNIVDETQGTSATFEHLNEDYEWFEQAGLLEWGQQQLVPSGEISVLPLFHGNYSADKRLVINGEISFKGMPILHSGKPSFLREDQQRIYSNLVHIKDHAIVAQVQNGFITDLHSTHPTTDPVVEMLEAMFEIDSRYRIIWEIGFGINFQLEMLSKNSGMNEVYGGGHGVIHWGLGLTPWTQYHLDINLSNDKSDRFKWRRVDWY
jgi:hypothetical protein